MEGRSERRSRRVTAGDKPVRRGLFGGNVTVRYGLIVFLLSLLFLQFYNRMYEGVRLYGPIDDVFLKKSGNLAIVYATGTDDDAGLSGYAGKVSELLGRKLSRKIPVYADRDAGRRRIADKSLLLYGPVPQNRVARRMSGHFPFRFEGGRLGWGKDNWLDAPDWRLVFIWPNPDSRSQYVLVYAAAEASRVIGINLIESPNFVPHDTTDYVLAAGDSILASGYFDKDSSGTWTLPAGALALPGR